MLKWSIYFKTHACYQEIVRLNYLQLAADLEQRIFAAIFSAKAFQFLSSHLWQSHAAAEPQPASGKLFYYSNITQPWERFLWHMEPVQSPSALLFVNNSASTERQSPLLQHPKGESAVTGHSSTTTLCSAVQALPAAGLGKKNHFCDEQFLWKSVFTGGLQT